MTGSAPPAIPGFDALAPLGAGGFSDVYLYEQHLPRRRVAVKVLSGEGFDQAGLSRFRDEANLMAQLSTHPSIVTVYQAGVTEGGSPYLVMEYCSLPDYGARFRTERISVQEALSVGIQIAGALETAHRAGVLHRDIKPSNILVTDYRRPALADFGIAGVLGGAPTIDAYSVLWTSPEALGDGAVLRPTSDVYSLAATVYALLAGRAPFESSAGPEQDTPADVLARMREQAVPPIGRPDVPPELEELLATALSPSPSARHTSALSFGRALQQVEARLGLPPTTLDALDDPYSRDRTATVQPSGSTGPAAPAVPPAPTAVLPPAPTTVLPPTPTAPTERWTQPPAQSLAGQASPSAGPASSPLDSTVRREAAPSPVYTAPQRTRPRWPGVLLDVVLVVAVAGAAAYWFLAA
ncbi:serine/threonine protein kinase [Cnuibacter physcomitrellae]|uniref:serine/threonine-protein kinase n=1 Tax=Cnuibacter physcomitrellae TaxID=1619308 RepID=UPI0021760CE0|nr:serine/threonine-protein kinase [Cnuibacter physcomitrellae]MCS5496620.1 serine/threonine protein kinase [Cnuibacter physcomitrellae]